MYSFDPSEEQQMLIDAINRYARTDLRNQAHDCDEEGHLPYELVEKGWELGYLQASIPDEYGGFGERSVVTGVLAVEEMAWGDLARTLAVMTPGVYVIPILLAGNEEQKQQYIPEVIEAEWVPYTAAIIEPRFDFDPNALNVIAKEDGDNYIISGEKCCVPYADEAKAMLVYANLSGETQAFILPSGLDRLVIGEREKLMGIHAYPLFKVSLNDVKVPKSNRLGGVGGHEFAPIMDASRTALAAMAVGLARAAFEYARDYAKERDVFKVKVAQKQAIAFMMAEMATEIEAIRLLNWEAAWMLDNQKESASKQAYLALTGAIDMVMMVTDRAVQILGGHGYIREHPVEMWMRNGRGIAMMTGLSMI